MKAMVFLKGISSSKNSHSRLFCISGSTLVWRTCFVSRHLGWPFALLYRWEMMWTLTIPKLWRGFCPSAVWFYINFIVMSICRTQMYSPSAFELSKPGACFYPGPCQGHLFGTCLIQFFSLAKLEKNRIFWRWGGWEAVSTRPFLDELRYENRLTCHPKQVAQSQALAQQLTRQMARILEQKLWLKVMWSPGDGHSPSSLRSHWQHKDDYCVPD